LGSGTSLPQYLGRVAFRRIRLSEREFVFGHPKVLHTGQEDEPRESILRESVFGVAQQFSQRAYHCANRNHDDSERNENDGRGGIGMLRRKPSQ
jgi:hypothetical protein